MKDELTTRSLSELAALIRAREVSPVEVVEAHLRRIERLNPQLNAVVTLAPDAVEKAREAEALMMRGEARGALHGVPITVKDTIETRGLLTTGGSRVRAGYVPARDATAVARVRAAGAIVLGKTNVAEMAAAYETKNPVSGRTNNPYDVGRTPGGSSGGEAAAIAACLSPGGLGSDLMGSIRVPAHFCGIAGLKPTSGSVPGDGHLPASEGVTSLGAVIGPLARKVEDVRLLFRVIAGMDESRAVNDVRALDVRAARVAWYAFDGVTPVSAETRGAVSAAVRALEEAGMKVREERPPGVERGQELWSKLFARAALLEMKREYAGAEAEAGEFVRYLLESSKNAEPPAFDEFARAWKERDLLRARLLEWMEETPFILAPVGAMPAFEHGARKVSIEGESLSIFRAFSYAQTFNVLGLPAACVPVARTPEGLPVGVQVIGRPFADEAVLQVAALLEERLGGWQPPALSNQTDLRL